MHKKQGLSSILLSAVDRCSRVIDLIYVKVNANYAQVTAIPMQVTAITMQPTANHVQLAATEMTA